MAVTVELYGIARQRAGTSQVSVPGHCLGDVLAALGQQFPRFAASCLQDGRLQAGFLANIGGERFVSEPGTPLVAGDHLLIMSTDAGG